MSPFAGKDWVRLESRQTTPGNSLRFLQTQVSIFIPRWLNNRSLHLVPFGERMPPPKCLAFSKKPPQPRRHRETSPSRKQGEGSKISVALCGRQGWNSQARRN